MFGDASDDTSGPGSMTPLNCNKTSEYLHDYNTEPIIGDWQFHDLNMLVSGLCAAFSTLLIIALMIMHTLHFSKVMEQLEILRICLLIPVYAMLSLAAIVNPNAWVFVKPWIEVAQGYALANYWILVCRFLAPEGADYTTIFFSPLGALNEIKSAKGKKTLTPKKYRRHFVYILQGPFVMGVVAVATNINEIADHFCVISNADLIRTVLSCVTIASMAAAMTTAIRHSTALHGPLKPYRAMFKMLSFKLLLGFYIILEIVMMILENIPDSPVDPDKFTTLSVADLEVGIPMMATCCELVFFAIFFYFAYSVTPYKITTTKPDYYDLSSEDEMAPRQVAPAAGPNAYVGGKAGMRAWLKMLICHRDLWEAFKFPFIMMRKVPYGIKY